MSLRYSQIVGHDRIRKTLAQARAAGRVAHAYLFSGPDGIGKERMARTFFTSLLCIAAQDEPCGECTSCHKLARGTHPDVLILEPDGRFIKIDAVRQVTKVVHYPPLEGRYRCVLVLEAHALHEAAANALLKTLEEPSSQTIFVLVSSAAQRLLPTIISRCQSVRFSPLPDEAMRALLIQEHGIDAARVDGLVGAASGSVGAALEMADDVLVERREKWFQVLAGLRELETDQMLQLGEEMSAEKGTLPAHLTLVRSWYRDLMVLSAGGDGALVTNQDWRESLLRVSDGLGVEEILQGLELIDEVEASLRFNVNARLAAERLLLGLHGHGS